MPASAPWPTRDIRDLIAAEIAAGVSGWENIATDPGWEGLRISFAASFPEWAGRSLADLADELDADPADLAFDALVADRLDVSVVIDCMDEADVETIMAVPWIAVCTDAEGRRPGHPVLDAGRPHPRTYGSTARVLGRYVRERGVAVARDGRRQARAPCRPHGSGLHDRGIVREGAFADLVVFDPATVADLATYAAPARYPTGIDHVVVNGRPAILDGAETGERPGRLLRRSSEPTGPWRRSPIRGATETPAVVRLPGGPLAYTLRRSPRSRGLRVVIHPTEAWW